MANIHQSNAFSSSPTCLPCNQRRIRARLYERLSTGHKRRYVSVHLPESIALTEALGVAYFLCVSCKSPIYTRMKGADSCPVLTLGNIMIARFTPVSTTIPFSFRLIIIHNPRVDCIPLCFCTVREILVSTAPNFLRIEELLNVYQNAFRYTKYTMRTAFLEASWCIRSLRGHEYILNCDVGEF